MNNFPDVPRFYEKQNDQLVIGVSSKMSKIDNIQPMRTIIHNESNVEYLYVGANALDKMDNVCARDYMKHCENTIFNQKDRFQNFTYNLIHDLAIPPHKTRFSDSGFDLTLININKKIGKVTLYGTGVIVTPPTGFYFDMVPRSSIIKSGYMLANSLGIIDQGYTGEVLVPLVKIDEEAPDLELPAKLVQLIPRKWYGFNPVNVDEVYETSRNTKGFGSTGD